MVKSTRLIDIWLYINNHKKFTTTELATKFNVSTRTIQRDIDELSLLGVPFYSEVGRNGGYTMLNQEILPPISFSEDEIISIILTYKSMTQYQNLPYQFEIESVVEKLLSNSSLSLLERLRQVEESFYLRIPERNEETPFLKEIFQASLERNCIEISYDSLRSESKKTLCPIGIYSDNGYWYFCAIDNKLDDLRTYRVDRIKSLEVKGESETLGKSITIKEALERQDSVINLDKQSVRLKVNKKAVRILNTLVLDFSNVKWEDNYWGIYEEVHSLHEIDYLASLLSVYGNNIEILEPLILIEKFREHLEKIVEIYE